MLPMFPDVFGRGQFDAQSTGLGLLGQTAMVAAGIASPVVTIEPRDFLLLVAIVPGLSAAGQPGMRFGGSPGMVDSSAAYWSRNMMATNNSAIVPGNFGNDPTPSATQLKLGYARSDAVQTDISDLGGTTHRMIFMTIWNLPGQRATCQWAASRATGAAATVGKMWSGWGEWVGPSPIRSIQLTSFDTAVNLNAKSSFNVWGSTLP